MLKVMRKQIFNLDSAEVCQDYLRVGWRWTFNVVCQRRNFRSLGGALELGEIFRRKNDPDASRLSGRPANKPASFQRQNHLMNTWRGDLEKLHHICFRRRAAMQHGIMVDESQKLALSRCVGRFHSGHIFAARSKLSAHSGAVKAKFELFFEMGQVGKGNSGRYRPKLHNF